MLGPCGATVGGRAADLGGPRQRAVLARLVVAGGEVVSTDLLVHDLWGEAEVPAKALAVLQVHVSHLRRALEPGRARRAPAGVLVSAAPGYALRLPVEQVDAWRFDDLVRRAAGVGAVRRHELLTAALGCWGGPAYAEVADEAWAVPEVARLTELRLTAVEARAGADLELGRPGPVIADLERLLHDHPGREEAVRLLVLALYRTGRQGDALGVLRRTREHLAGELGLDPGPALRALETAVLTQDAELDHEPAAAPVPLAVEPERPRPGAGLRGRDSESAALAAAAAEVAGGGARVAWVGGEPGAGKTTLADAVARELARDGWRLARGRSPEVEGAPPGWAWTEATAHDRAASEANEQSAAKKNTANENAGDKNAGDERNPFRFGQAVARLLDDERPTVVVLDDLHRADDLTLQVLRQVLAQLAARPLLVIGTYRGTELGDELAATIAALLTVTAAHVRLGGLDPGAVAALAAEQGLTRATPELLAMLSERTGGNPLFVRELARLIAAEGPGAAGAAVPAGVREVLRRRVARLPGSATAALRQAAVLGREVDVDVLAEVARRDPDDLLDALETAVLAGLLDEPAPGQVRFTHALVRDTLYDDMPLLRRARLHASALLAYERRRADAATLAYHAAASAGPATAHEAVPYAVAAAREAQAVGAYGEAARQWTSALRLRELAGRRTAGDDDGLLDLLTPAVAALARAGDFVRARQAYLRATAVARPLGRARAPLTAWDAPLIWTTREARDPDPVTLAALRSELAADLGPATRAALLIALFREVEGYDVAEAIEVSAEALELARSAGDDRLLCAALNARAYAALGPDLRTERRAVTEEYLRVAAATGQIDHEAVAHWLLFLESSARTDLGAAVAEMRLAVERCQTGQLGGLLSVVAIFTALLDVLAGRPDAALARYEEAAARLTEHGAINGAMMAVVGRISVAMYRGDLGPLRAELEAVDYGFPGRITDPLVLAMLDGGDEDAARRVWARRTPIDRDYYWLGFMALRSHAAARLGDLDVARAAYEDLLPFSGRFAGADSGTLYAGPVDSALAALARALGRPAEAAAHEEAAAALLHRVAAALQSS
nr:BTAD domain-containing putative transcriptional regulator [Couchioplanes caeruleus]